MSFFLFLLLCLAPWSAAHPALDPIGETEGVEGKAEFLRPPSSTWKPLNRRDEIQLLDHIRTQSGAKVEVLLQSGHKFAIGENVEITVTEQPAPPTGSRVVLLLAQGTVRVVTSGRPGTSIVTRTATGQATARSTGFIVSCGPPRFAIADDCLYIGLSGHTEVEALTFPGQSVTLEKDFYTEIQNGQPPALPQAVTAALLQTFLSATTLGMNAAATTTPSVQAARITGQVHTVNGAPVNTVGITAVNEEGQIVARAVTNEKGEYAFENLTPGRYTLTLDPNARSVKGQTVVVSVGLAGLDVGWTVSETAPAIATATPAGTPHKGLLEPGKTGTFLGVIGAVGAGIGGAAAGGAFSGEEETIPIVSGTQ